jgi:hypothetical protein
MENQSFYSRGQTKTTQKDDKTQQPRVLKPADEIAK